MENSVRNKLIEQSLETIDKELKFFSNKHYLYRFMSKEDIEDMRSECILNLINTIEKFNSNRDIKLNTYIIPRIKGFFKDYLNKMRKEKERKNEALINEISKKIDNLLKLDNNQIILYLKELHLSKDNIRDICMELPETEIISSHIYDSLLELPDNLIYTIIGFYLLDKSIKEISYDLNISPNSGWIYRIKKQSIKYLRNRLKEKGVF